MIKKHFISVKFVEPMIMNINHVHIIDHTKIQVIHRLIKKHSKNGIITEIQNSTMFKMMKIMDKYINMVEVVMIIIIIMIGEVEDTEIMMKENIIQTDHDQIQETQEDIMADQVQENRIEITAEEGTMTGQVQEEDTNIEAVEEIINMITDQGIEIIQQVEVQVEDTEATVEKEEEIECM